MYHCVYTHTWSGKVYWKFGVNKFIVEINGVLSTGNFVSIIETLKIHKKGNGKELYKKF